MLLTMFSTISLERLMDNAKTTQEHHEANLSPPDHAPLVRLHCPESGVSLLLSEYDTETRSFFGLCDYGMGRIALGPLKLEELETFEPPLHVDHSFQPRARLMAYLKAAHRPEQSRLILFP